MRTVLAILAAILFASCASKPAEQGADNKYEISGTIKVEKSCDKEWILRYEQKDIKALRERAESEKSECDVLFFGSSSIRLWKSLKEDFAPYTVVNRGYGGATLRDLHYYYTTVMAHYRPRAFVIYCDNDLRTKTEIDIPVGELFDLYRMLFDRIDKDYPDTPILFLSVKHSKRREAIRNRQAVFNSLMKEYADSSDHITFVDVTTPLLKADGSVDTSLFLEDNIHLNSEGYKRWVAAIRPVLDSLLNKK